MEQDTKAALKGFFIAAIIVASLSAIATGMAQAKEPTPSAQNLQDLKDIKENQVCISKNRDAYNSVKNAVDSDKKLAGIDGYNAFLDCKAWNQSEVENLAKDGWCVSWADDPKDITLKQCEKEQHTAAGYDLDKLSKAVACAETSCGKDGTARGRNNLHGIMCWPNGKRTPCYFKTPEDSHKRFKEIWVRSYGKFPDRALAVKWTGNDHPDTWLANVTSVYKSL